jgi:hypothetical protein
MNSNGKLSQGIDFALYERNRRLIPANELEPFAGQHVAFSADGTQVVAHGEGYEGVFAHLDSLGIDGNTVVLEYIPGPNEDTWL